MALMEWRCNYQAFGRGIQPAITNSPTHLNQVKAFFIATLLPDTKYFTLPYSMRKESSSGIYIMKDFLMEFYPIIFTIDIIILFEYYLY